MEINWRTIEKDGIPPVGSFCLCKLEGGYSSCGYMILLVSSVAGNRLFTLYYLLVPQGKIMMNTNEMPVTLTFNLIEALNKTIVEYYKKDV